MTRLPIQHEVTTANDPETDFIPRRARESDIDEVEWRRRYAGTNALVLRQQLGGIGIARSMLKTIEDPHERGIAAQILSAAHISTVRHIFAKDPEGRYKKRHNIKYPLVARVDGWRMSPDEFEDLLFTRMDESAELTTQMIERAKERKPTTRLTMDTARTIGNTGTMLANFPLYRLSEQSAPKDIQNMIVEGAKAADERALRLTKKFKMKPTLAMLAEDTSPLGIELRTSPYDAVAEAYEAAYAAYDPAESR